MVQRYTFYSAAEQATFLVHKGISFSTMLAEESPSQALQLWIEDSILQV